MKNLFLAIILWSFLGGAQAAEQQEEVVPEEEDVGIEVEEQEDEEAGEEDEEEGTDERGAGPAEDQQVSIYLFLLCWFSFCVLFTSGDS